MVDHTHIEKRLEARGRRRRFKRKPKMKVTGRQAFKLRDTINKRKV